MINDLSKYMAEQLAAQLAEEQDKIVQACIRKRVGPEVRIKDVLIANRISRVDGSDEKSEIWLLDGRPMVEIWKPETKDEATADGNGTRMVASIAYRVMEEVK